MSATLTACVIVRDEERHLPECLAGLRFCDEVVVVDSGSRDRTVEIARAAGARVIENRWPGFAAQRNVALDHARGDWVLEIDADERVTPELAAEIRERLERLPAEVRMVAVPMRDIFLGRPLGPSSRYPRYRHRLFRRGAFRHDEARTVHEGLWPDGPTAVLEGELRHLLASGWGEAVCDTVAYARLDATQHTRPGPAEALKGVVARPLAKLLYRLLIYGGWRDGARGLARIWLECAGDSLATLLRLRGATQQGGAAGLGQEAPRIGPVRLVGVGSDPGKAAALAAWLEEADAAGADVALIAPRPPGDATLPCRRLEGPGPGALARALDAEDQVRPIDALVLDGGRERLLLRLAPRALRGATEPLASRTPAAEAVREVQRSTRPPVAT